MHLREIPQPHAQTKLFSLVVLVVLVVFFYMLISAGVQVLSFFFSFHYHLRGTAQGMIVLMDGMRNCNAIHRRLQP